ncbi:PACE efflux transporter [Falsirhodobacter deserti]|uniref:PACE efflux transporter n=1 Tax=Falsirhodobacter deserti TaxID=1365611 RepID=UPI000FE3D7E1|nr:PACE efflux transporter [Falsirhodobacter deserti]
MRKSRDRIRHAISFELIGLALIIPLGAIGFGLHPQDMGVVAVVGSTVATLWNYVYNLGFDHAMKRIRGTVHKTMTIRVLHTVLFELGLLVVALPFIAWYLEIGLWAALVLDLAAVVFYVIYAFIFNWIYDRVFPLPADA